MVAPIGESRKEANRIKRETPITVVIGNPPYKEKAKDRGGWIEDGSAGREAPMDRWTPPREWGVGAHAKHLEESLYLFLALGDFEGVRLRLECSNRRAG